MPALDFDHLLQSGRYSSRLPEGYPGAPVGPLGVPEDWAQRTIEAATLLSGHLLQGVALDGGWTAPAAELDGMLALAERVAGSDGDPLEIADALRDFLQNSDLIRAALGPQLAQVQEAIMGAIAAAVGGAVLSAAEAVPIIGWAITFIRFAVQAGRIRQGHGAAFGATPLIEGYNRWPVPEYVYAPRASRPSAPATA